MESKNAHLSNQMACTSTSLTALKTTISSQFKKDSGFELNGQKNMYDQN